MGLDGLSRYGMTPTMIPQEKAVKIKSDNTVKDEVLDLSNASTIADELGSQDLNSVKAIKIGNQLIEVPDKATLQKIVADLKSSILEGNQLKSGVNLQELFKETGLSSEIKPLTQTTPDTGSDPITEKTVALTPRFNEAVKSKDPQKMGEVARDINVQIQSLDTELNTLKASPTPNQQRIDQLTNQKNKLEQKRDVLSLISDIGKSSTLIDGEIAKPSTQNAAKHAQILSNSAGKLQEEATILMAKTEGLDPDVAEACNGAIKEAIGSSKKANEEVLLMSASDGNKALGKGGGVTDLKNTYRAFQAVVKPVSERTPEDKKLVGVDYRLGYQPTTESFLKSINDDIKSDIVSAGKLKQLSSDIQSGKLSSETDIRAAVKKALPGINTKKIEIVSTVYINASKLKGAERDLALVKHEQEIFNVALKTANTSLDQMKAMSGQIDQTLQSIKPVDISKAHLAPKSQGQVTTDNVANIAKKSELQTELTQVKARTSQLENQYSEFLTKKAEEDAEKELHGEHSLLASMGEGDDIAYGSHKTVSFEGLVSVGVDAKLLKGTLEAGYKLEFTVEKSDGPANTPVWLAHVDLSAVVKAKGSLLCGLIEAEASAEFTGTAGLGFNSLGEAKEFGAKVQNFLKTGEGAKELLAEIKKHQYLGIAGTLSAKGEIFKGVEGSGSVKAGGRVYGTGVTEQYITGKAELKIANVSISISATQSNTHNESETVPNKRDQSYTAVSIKLEFPPGKILPESVRKQLAQKIFDQIGGVVPLHEILESITKSEVESKLKVPSIAPKAKIGFSSELRAVAEFTFATKTDDTKPGHVIRRYEVAVGTLSKSEVKLEIPPAGTTPGGSFSVKSETEKLTPLIEMSQSVPEGTTLFTTEGAHIKGQAIEPFVHKPKT